MSSDLFSGIGRSATSYVSRSNAFTTRLEDRFYQDGSLTSIDRAQELDKAYKQRQEKRKEDRQERIRQRDDVRKLEFDQRAGERAEKRRLALRRNVGAATIQQHWRRMKSRERAKTESARRERALVSFGFDDDPSPLCHGDTDKTGAAF